MSTEWQWYSQAAACSVTDPYCRELSEASFSCGLPARLFLPSLFQRIRRIHRQMPQKQNFQRPFRKTDIYTPQFSCSRYRNGRINPFSCEELISQPLLTGHGTRRHSFRILAFVMHKMRRMRQSVSERSQRRHPPGCRGVRGRQCRIGPI